MFQVAMVTSTITPRGVSCVMQNYMQLEQEQVKFKDVLGRAFSKMFKE